MKKGIRRMERRWKSPSVLRPNAESKAGYLLLSFSLLPPWLSLLFPLTLPSLITLFLRPSLFLICVDDLPRACDYSASHARLVTPLRKLAPPRPTLVFSRQKKPPLAQTNNERLKEGKQSSDREYLRQVPSRGSA